jgi:hypothetical protein
MSHVRAVNPGIWMELSVIGLPASLPTSPFDPDMLRLGIDDFLSTFNDLRLNRV